MVLKLKACERQNQGDIRGNYYASKNRFRILLKRAYEFKTIEKLRDFVTVESPEFQPEAV